MLGYRAQRRPERLELNQETRCAMENDSDDIRAIEALIHRQIGSLNWTPETSGDWSTFAADFVPGACLYPAARPAKRQTPEDFIERMKGVAATSLRSFKEAALGSRIRVFGNVAVAVAACEMTENDARVNRGVEMMLLIKTDGEWKIVAQAWDTENESRPIPTDLRQAPAG
jgi:ketosteroid isomerase-like protein